MRLGVFGGTFDPIHYGHLLLAERCREQRGLSAVWFLPAATPPHKQGQPIAPAADRIAMIELAIAGNPALAVCRHEADRLGVGYTVETLERLRAEDPGRELFLLVGADMLADLPRWREPARICELAVPVVVGRPGFEVDFDCLAGVVDGRRLDEIRRHRVEMPAIGTSSTELRQRVSAGLSIRYGTPRAVEKYIEERGLYRTAEGDSPISPASP